jgi:hypothetical protein
LRGQLRNGRIRQACVSHRIHVSTAGLMLAVTLGRGILAELRRALFAPPRPSVRCLLAANPISPRVLRFLVALTQCMAWRASSRMANGRASRLGRNPADRHLEPRNPRRRSVALPPVAMPGRVGLPIPTSTMTPNERADGCNRASEKFPVVIAAPTKSCQDHHVRLGPMKCNSPFVQRVFLQKIFRSAFDGTQSRRQNPQQPDRDHA